MQLNIIGHYYASTITNLLNDHDKQDPQIYELNNEFSSLNKVNTKLSREVPTNKKIKVIRLDMANVKPELALEL